MTRINATFPHNGRSYKAIESSSHKIEVYQILDDGLEIFAGYTYNIPPNPRYLAIKAICDAKRR